MKKGFVLAILLWGMVGCSVSQNSFQGSFSKTQANLKSVYSGSSDVMIQAYSWESHNPGWWMEISNRSGELRAAGFTLVWLPPFTASVSPEGFLPTKLYDLNSAYGTATELSDAITTLHKDGMKAIGDIVVNHRSGTYQINEKWHGFEMPDWEDWAVVCNDTGQDSGSGGWDTGDDCYYAPDIDHNNAQVQADIKTWLNWLRNDIGFDGWRWDMVRGFSASFVQEYNTASAPVFSVGEYWSYNRQEVIDWINQTGGTSSAFDFATRDLLLQACEQGKYWVLKDNENKPAGMIGWWSEKSVTFVENHDTEEARGSIYAGSISSNNTLQAYAYILTHPGVPTVFWPDWRQFPDAISNMIALRREMGITSTSSVAIQVADASQYAAVVDGKVAVRIGNGNWTPGSDWELALSGSGYAIWTKSSGSSATVRTVVFMYKQTVSGQDIFIKGGHDGGLVDRGYYPAMAEPITYNNTLNQTTAAIKATDDFLDWFSESALDWTCDSWPTSWGTKRTYANDGYGEDPENHWGAHWWKFDVQMQGNVGGWYEFKAFMREGASEYWENDIAQNGTPYQSINHWGRKGYVTRVRFGENWVEFVPIP